ncbi:SDR family oxidoreductase [Erwinia sp. 9145]|uniref:SDR family oxidoreductase n=1 Tax=Erwinia sp. 9145 TaxID=1500895 RepID=UPI00055838FE|nr:SDR family oxidoreductase [Erwinia sp. 9145]
MNKKDQTVFITGAGRGVGMAMAQEFAAQGYDLILNYRKDQGKSAAGLQQFLVSPAAQQVSVRLAKADISEPREIAEMVKKLKQGGVERIDHLVLNAASAPFKPFSEMTRSDWKLLLNGNIIGNNSCVNEIVPLMPVGGSICIISSMGSRRVLPDYPLGIVKSALESLVGYLEVELYAKGIRVNGLCAGMVNTDMAEYLQKLWPELYARYEHSPRRWLIEPKEVADIAAFLISPQSSAIRGTTLVADLGMSLSA